MTTSVNAMAGETRDPSGQFLSPARPRALVTRLQSVHCRGRRVALGTGLAATVVALVGACALTLLLDRLFDLPGIGRFLAAAAILIVASVGLTLGVLSVVLRRMDPESVALCVEGHFGGMQSLLISALQLGRSEAIDSGASSAMMDMVKRQADEQTAGLDFRSVVTLRVLKRLALAAAAAVVLAGGYGAWQPRMVAAWAGRLVDPFDPSRVYPTQTHLTPLTGDLAVPAGEFATVKAYAGGRVPATGIVRYWQGGGQTGRLEISADTADGRTFTLTLGPVAEDTWYRFEVGDARTKKYVIEALPRPRLVDLEVQPRLPPYVRAPDPPPQRLREVRALMGTEIHLTGRARVPSRAQADEGEQIKVDRAAVILASGPTITGPVAPDGTFTAKFRIVSDDAYRIELAYEVEQKPAPARPDGSVPADRPAITVRSDRPIWYAVHAVADKPPAIKIVEPGPTTDASPVGQVVVKAEITDDYGVEGAQFWYAIRRAPPTAATGVPETSESGRRRTPPARTAPAPASPTEPPTLPTTSSGEGGAVDRRAFIRADPPARYGSRRVSIEHPLNIARTGARPGDRIFYYLSAADARQEPVPGVAVTRLPVEWRDNPNVAESEMYEIAVVTMAEIERQLRQKGESVWEEIYRLYRRERDLRREVEDIRSTRPTSRPAESRPTPPVDDEPD